MAVISATEPDRIRVCITASDPISRAGIASQLESHGGLEIVGEANLDSDVVALVAADQLDEESAQLTKTMMRRGVRGVALVLTRVDDAGLMGALAAGARGLLLRSRATPDNLFETIRAVAVGDRAVRPDLLGPLARQGHSYRTPGLEPAGPELRVADRPGGQGSKAAGRRLRYRRSRSSPLLF
jgi:DNA-binding NarL/FixJ family response regulator